MHWACYTVEEQVRDRSAFAEKNNIIVLQYFIGEYPYRDRGRPRAGRIPPLRVEKGREPGGKKGDMRKMDQISNKTPPSMDAWLREAKAMGDAARVGMYLVHNGVVRQDARALVREGDTQAKPVRGMRFSSDGEKVRQALAETLRLPGVFYARAWLNEGMLRVGDDLMFVMVGGDIRPRVIDALQYLVGKLKSECVTEEEITEAG